MSSTGDFEEDVWLLGGTAPEGPDTALKARLSADGRRLAGHRPTARVRPPAVRPAWPGPLFGRHRSQRLPKGVERLTGSTR